MASQLNMLLCFFRLDCGKEEISSVLFRTTDIVRTLEEFQPQMAQKVFLLLIENCTDNIVVGDRNRIVQIGENLLFNALKFTRREFIRLTSSYYRLCVEDIGSGITPEEQKRVFNSFERLPNALTQEGFELGLSIMDSLVRLLGGSMELESKEGKGSCLVVNIPIMLAEEGNNMLSDIVKEIFAKYNISCDTCTHVGELIRDKRYDLLIMDLKTPGMDGFDILKLLRTSNVNNSRSIPAIVATASGLCNESDLLASGFDGCLFKSFSAQELMSVSERYVLMDIQADIEPDFTMLLAYGDRVSILDRLIETTKHDMEEMKAAGNRHDNSLVAGEERLNSQEAYWACLTRNRDLDGDGTLENDEIRWYNPVCDQILGL